MKKLGFLFLYVFQLSCTSQTNPKINGVSFVSSREKAKQEDVNSIKEIHANHAAVMPFGFVRAVNSPEIIFNTDRQWYGAFILTYANLAQKAHVNIFCIGTELEQFVSHRPEYWHALISKIRKVYSGKLTYADH